MPERSKKIVAILDSDARGALSAYVAHTFDPERCRRMNMLAARAYLVGKPYSPDDYPAAAWVASVLSAGREPRFVVLEDVNGGATAAERRRVAWVHMLDREGVALPVQGEEYVGGMRAALASRLAEAGYALPAVPGAASAALSPRSPDAPPPWHTPNGAIPFHTLDGKVYRYSPPRGMFCGDRNLEVFYGPPGYGKSMLLGQHSLAFLRMRRVDQPVFVGIDLGCGMKGVVDLYRDDLTAERRREVGFVALRAARGVTVNPFDTHLGCRAPTRRQRKWLVRLLTLACSSLDEGGDPAAPYIADAVALLVDLAYADPAPARVYLEGEVSEVDAALPARRRATAEGASWWDVSVMLIEEGACDEAAMAQAQAVPRLPDLVHLILHRRFASVFGNVVLSNGARFAEELARRLARLERDMPFMCRSTRARFPYGCLVRLVDIDHVAPRGGSVANRKTALAWMLAHKTACDDLLADADVFDLVHSAAYRWHEKRQFRFRQYDARFVYDEYHRFDHASRGAANEQVADDLAALRHVFFDHALCVASQSPPRFSADVKNRLRAVWVLGCGTERMVDEIDREFDMPEGFRDAALNRLNGPTSHGMSFFAKIASAQGVSSAELRSQVDPETAWALSSAAEDRVLRETVAARIGLRDGLKALAATFPRGSARGEFERRCARARDTGAPDGAGIVAGLAEEVARWWRGRNGGLDGAGRAE